MNDHHQRQGYQRQLCMAVVLLAGTLLLVGFTLAAEPDSAPSSRRLDSTTAVAERDRLWQEAAQRGGERNWAEAARLAMAALKVQREQLTDRPALRAAETCQMLDTLCNWHTRLRDFPAALDEAKESLRVQSAMFGPEHWQTVDARLNVDLVERLSRLTADEWGEFVAADELQAQAADLQQQGKTAAALQKAEQVLPIYTRLVGRSNPLTLTCLTNVLICHIELGQYFKAQPYLVELLDLQPRVKGTVHPDTVATLRLLARFNESIGNLAHAEEALRKCVEIRTAMFGLEHPETLRDEVDLAKVCSDQGNFTAAGSLLLHAFKQQQKLFGEEHLATAQTKKILGTMYCEQNKYAEAEPLLLQSAATFRQLAGDKHLATAGALCALGKLYLKTGRYRQANDALTESAAICLAQLGDNHPVTAKVLDVIADLYETGANPGLARQVRLQCLRVAEQSFGEMNPLTANALENVARTYTVLNDFGLAEPYLLRAREIRGKLLGDEHPKTIAIVGQLGYVYLGAGEPARAEPLFLQALTSIEKSSDPDSAEGAKIRKRLALLYQSQGKFDEAESQYRFALRTIEKLAGPDDSATAEVKVGLAQTVLSRGNGRESCRLIDEALRVYERSLPKDHPQWLDALGVAATAHLAAGEWDQARVLLTRGLRISQQCMQTAGAYQSERQRVVMLTFMRHMLDLYLSLPIDLHQDNKALYSYVLSWKGAAATRQWRDRQYANADTAPLDAELRQIAKQLSALTLHPPAAADRQAWIGQIFTLNMRKEALEQQRAVYSSKLHGDPHDATVAEVQQVLPKATALIDILQYTHTSFKKTNDKVEMFPSQRYLAFVVRRDEMVTPIDLGDVPPIASAVAAWRKTRGFRPDPGKTDWSATVGDLLWPRLSPHVKDCDTLLISPDGVLSQLAWNVLPGRTAGSYLIEDYAIGMVPVPQLLPAIEAVRRDDTRVDNASQESFLLVGDIDYNASRSEKESELTHSAGPFHFSALGGTAGEMQALSGFFRQQYPQGRLTQLRKSDATEEALWREAPRHRWLHIATHGFFAPQNIRSAIATQQRMDPASRERQGVSIYQVNDLNGLALAGANGAAAANGDDGIVTAAELATMDLHNVQLCVLSGCETGLGEAQGGEGAFGMQRALQTAGVRATVGSLWTVPDAKTSLLMQRFYSNLWQRKLPRLQALREAQLWMLHTGGVASPAASSTPPDVRLSPHDWGAFTLSGDWR
ncbi:MAG: CHAT domain-containing protein [Planctomycetia bacterium]|nr:CHAT domain-containing protein [Planctomycetia bacterium]